MDPLERYNPSLEKSKQNTVLKLPFNFYSNFFVEKSHKIIDLSYEADAKIFPQGENINYQIHD